MEGLWRLLCLITQPWKTVEPCHPDHERELILTQHLSQKTEGGLRSKWRTRLCDVIVPLSHRLLNVVRPCPHMARLDLVTRWQRSCLSSHYQRLRRRLPRGGFTLIEHELMNRQSLGVGATVPSDSDTKASIVQPSSFCLWVHPIA